MDSPVTNATLRLRYSVGDKLVDIEGPEAAML